VKLNSTQLNIPNIDSDHINISELFLKDECLDDIAALHEIKSEEMERVVSVNQLSNRGRRYNIIPNINPSQDGFMHEVKKLRFIEYIFYNIIFQIHDSHVFLTIVQRGSLEMELGFANLVVDDIFSILVMIWLAWLFLREIGCF